MSRLPRVALGTVQAGADSNPITWALLAALTRNGYQPQHFHSRACYASTNGAATASGVSSRHLDDWLMSREVCRASFIHGAQSSDVAVVQGRFEASLRSTGGSAPRMRAGSLDVLCEWLDLPRVVVLDVARLRDSCLPRRLGADALLLDRVADGADYSRWKSALESQWGAPVLGALEALPEVRAALDSLPPGGAVPLEWCLQLGAEFARYARLDDFLALAARRDFPTASGGAVPAAVPGAATVAVAYDEVFHCYFPDTLDALESLGAAVVDFSPLHDESLPPGTDVVYIGCGHPELHAAALANNYCMLSALRTHLCAGRRMFADGGGLAYLCQYLETNDGKWAPMVGALPAIARRNPHPSPPQPVEMTLAESTWLGAAGQPLRGYLSDRWQIEPNGYLVQAAAEPKHAGDLLALYNAIGSRVQVHLAAQPALLRALVQPLAEFDRHRAHALAGVSP